MSHEPIRRHPENGRYFLFRGQPRALICATEHYGSVLNARFDFERYLDDAAERGQTLTRTFLLFRELQSARNPCSPCKPESPDYLAPWPRTGPGRALDGEPRYDLVSTYSPAAGQRSPAVPIEGGASALALGPFVHDLAILVTRRDT